MSQRSHNRQIAIDAARRHGIDVRLFLRQMRQEANFGDATSPAGAQGPAQIIPSTARAWGVRNVHDPHEAYDAAARNMAKYLRQYGGSWRKALIAYNAGPGRVGGPLPAETQHYIGTILGGSGGAHVSAPRSSPSPSRGFVTTGKPPRLNPGGTTTDNAGAIVAALLDPHKSTSLLDRFHYQLGTGKYTTTTPDSVTPGKSPRYFPGETTAASGGSPAHGGGSSTTNFDGKPVAAWIAHDLRRARATGLWKGSVTSGVRSKKEQLAAARRFGLQHYGPKGPLGSNHVEGHDGAVDVSDPEGLARALRKIHSPLHRGMADDPVHFSRTGH